ISCANTATFVGILIRPPLTESRSSIVNSSLLNSRFSLFRSVMAFPCVFQDGTIPADKLGHCRIHLRTLGLRDTTEDHGRRRSAGRGVLRTSRRGHRWNLMV